MQLRIVIFDFDGPVFDSWPMSREYIRFISRFTYYSEDEIRKMWGVRGDTLSKKLLEKTYWPLYVWPINKMMIRILYWIWRFKERRRDVELGFFKETLSVIEKLKKSGLVVGLLTNRTAKTLAPLIETLPNPTDYYFDFIQTFDPNQQFTQKIFKNHFSSKRPKPELAAFENIFFAYILPRVFAGTQGFYGLRAGPVEIIYVGDAISDLNFALNSGLKFFGVLTGPADTKEKWVSWSNGKITEEEILSSPTELLKKLKIPS